MSTKVHESYCLDAMSQRCDGFDHYLRKCRVCGLEAHNQQQLKSFRKNKKQYYGYENICRPCYNNGVHKKHWLNALYTLEDVPRCVNCGIEDIRVLSIDHINNDGNKERDGETTYKKIANLGREESRKHYQILCRNCNWEKYIIHSGKSPCSERRKRALLNISSLPYCTRCGETNLTYLSIDHLKNNGYEEYSTIGHPSTYTKIKKLDKKTIEDNYQILCRNCNWIKRRELRNER